MKKLPRKAVLAREVAALRRSQSGFPSLWADAAHLFAFLLGLARRMAAGEAAAVDDFKRHFGE